MNEKDNFALVPRPPGALEKTAPGAKRILSGMVADTLTLAKQPPPSMTRPLRIVMLDDESMLLEVYEAIFRQWFKDVTLLKFGNAEEGFKELMRKDPDLLLTDDMMPGMNCLELLDRLAATKATYPMIALCGYFEEHRIQEYANRGLNVTFLKKPFTPRQLLQIISQLLGLSDHAGPQVPTDKP